MRAIARLLVGMCLLVQSASSYATVDSYFGGRWGTIDTAAGLAYSSYAMAALNTGWSARFVAVSTADVLSVRVRWVTVTSPGAVTVRIETDDGTGKPSGTLYDANAVLTGQTPSTAGGSAGQLFTFAVAPTTGLTAGSAYHVVILTTTGGTAHTLASYMSKARPTSLPGSVLTAADGTTRSNFAEVASSAPIMVLGVEGGGEWSLELGALPWGNTSTNAIHGTNAVALTTTTPTTFAVRGVALPGLAKTGTPAGDLRIRIFDASDNTVSGASVTVDKDLLVSNISTNGITAFFPATVSLPTGTYRVVLDSASSANGSNCWNLNGVVALSATAMPAGHYQSTTTDVGGAPITWADATTTTVGASLILENMTLPGGSSGVIGG